MVGLEATGQSPLVFKKGGQSLTFKPHDDVIAFSQHVTDTIAVKDSDVVFVGYGVQAPEFNWDDFKGLDVKGKTIIVLVNDPPVPDPNDKSALDPRTFGGKAMTYYGRWTYKYEKAAELGAAAVFIVHETAPAGYPLNVVQGFGGERFDLVTPDKNMGRAAIQGWISLDAATKLFKLAGQDYQKLKAAGGDARLQARAAQADGVDVVQADACEPIESQNVIAKITRQRSGAEERVRRLLRALGPLRHVRRRSTATRSTTARATTRAAPPCSSRSRAQFKKVQPQPKRSILFLCVTSEEQGLLGSEYYGKFPLYPLDKTLANINVDELNVWGRTKDLTVIGLGASDLDDYARDAAAEQGRMLRPDSEPEKGFYYRSDHFNFAKVGVPAFDPDSGSDFIGKPAGYGQEKRDEWTTKYYHQATDQVQPGGISPARRRTASCSSRWVIASPTRTGSRNGSRATSSRRFATSR